MNRKFAFPLCALLAFASCNTMDKPESKENLVPVSFQEVKLEDNFWLPRLKIQKQTLVPFALGKTEPAVENLRRTANYLKGVKDELPFPSRFVSSDLFKVMEGAAYLLTIERDGELEKQMDGIIEIIGQAQEPDGYLYESHTTGVSKNHDAWGGGGMGDKPYSWVIHSHELYNMGHMYEGAVAYYQATGKDAWLKIALKNAKHINKVFFEGDPKYNGGKPVNQAPGHQEIELALVKLFRVTGDSLYLDMAKRFIDIRGVTYVPEGQGVMSPSYAQQHKPVREQTEAVGHSVRATYLYSAMADVSAQTADYTLRPALDSIWHNIVDTRMHITGGLGAIHGIEGFGPEYVLPNKDAYNETCAAVGNVFFNHRMFLMEKDAKYIDVAEVSLYNNVLAGVNMDGNKFFYVNPLEADAHAGFNQGVTGRSPWFGTACCPSNMARLIPQISGMMYAHTSDDIYCAFYAGNSVSIPLKDGAVQVKQETEYPFGEYVSFQVTPEKDGQQFAMRFRIPTWAGNQFVPGDLYHYMDESESDCKLFLNGKKIDNVSIHKGFATLNRTWNKGDLVELILPMPVRYNNAIEQVKADSSRVCITRGPLVYCAETADNAYPVLQYFIPDQTGDAEVIRETDGVLKGVDFAVVPAKVAEKQGEKESSLKLVPYYAWDNRGDLSMTVWIPQTAGMARESIFAFRDKIADVKASHTYDGDNVFAAADNKNPSDSQDQSIPRWTSWPQKGVSQWMELKLEKAIPIQSISVYWYNDNGGVQLPESWTLEYKENDTWVKFPLYVTDRYGVEENQFNMVHPGLDIVTDGIRLQMKPKKDAAVGILEIAVEEVKQ